MRADLPTHVAIELQSSETLISYIPEPDLTARRRILLAIFPTFVVMVTILVWFFIDRTSFAASAAGVYCIVALFVFALRLCRTSYVISTTRVVRFVKEKKVGEVEHAESKEPVLLDFAARDFFIVRWMAHFVSIVPVVEIRRLKPGPWTLKAFIFGGDVWGMRIGYPGHRLPIARIFDDLTLAWDAAQNPTKATP